MTFGEFINELETEIETERRNLESDLIWNIITLAMLLVPVTVFLGISLISLALR